MQVFQLVQITLNSINSDSRIAEFEKDGTVKIFRKNLGIFSSVAKCEEMMQKWVEKTKSWEELVLGYEVLEKTLDDDFKGPFNEICTFWSKRSYLSDLTLNCTCECDDTCIKSFTGHIGKLHCKETDLVWLLHEICVEPAVVVSLPASRVKGDYSDDCYAVVTSDGHEHPLVTDVYPFFGKLPKRISKKLDAEMKWYKSGKL